MIKQFALSLAYGVLLACAPAQGSPNDAEDPEPAAAPPKSPGETLVTRHTWPGTGGNEAAEGKWAPRDECGEIEGAYAFRIALAEAVRARDTDAVVAMAAPDIMLDFGGGSGRDLLRERLGDPSYELWASIEEVLSLGCASDGENGFALPWYWGQDMGDVDPFEAHIAMGENVPVFADRELSRQIAELDWDIARIDYSRQSDGIVLPLVLVDGREGYAREDSFRSIIDYRLLATRGDDGNFVIGAFIAGD